MQSLASASEGSGSDSADKANSTDKGKKQSGWLNKSLFLASAVLRNDHVAADKIATQMSNHDVAGPLIKKNMDSQRWYWMIG